MQRFTPENWKQYELIDCGDFEKLERFGDVIIRRPEPQAIWSKVFSETEWKNQADIIFKQSGSHKGEWINKFNKPSRWKIKYESNSYDIDFNLSLTSFKHVGIFPEQADNWDYIYRSIKNLKVKESKFLNLFAYTGGASLVAKKAGADVTHVDSVKQVISWSRENMELNRLENIRWVVDDAVKFVKREVKRGKVYNGIILDPPAFGIGPNGERWQLENCINELLGDVSKILDPENGFLILNVYSLGLSSIIVENLVTSNFKICNNFESGELYLASKSGIKLPLGVLARFYNG